MHEHFLSVFCLSVQWDYCDLSKRQDRSVLLDYKEKSYCSYLLRYWVAPSSVLWVVQEFFEIKIWDFGTKDLGKHTTKHRTSVLKMGLLGACVLQLVCCTPLPSQSKGTWGWLTHKTVAASALHISTHTHKKNRHSEKKHTKYL